MVLANTGCDRNNSDLQSAGTLILLPGLYRAYERERSVKIFALLSHRSASQAPPRPIAVSGFCKFRRIRANSAGEYSARTGNAGIRAWQGAGEASQDRNRGKPVLAAVRKGTPGPEMREYGLGNRPEGHPRTGNAEIRAWVGAKTADQDQNHRKLGLANTGCPRNYPGFRKLWVSLLFMTEVPIFLCQKMSIQSYLLHHYPCCGLQPNTNRRLNHLRNLINAL